MAYKSVVLRGHSMSLRRSSRMKFMNSCVVLLLNDVMTVFLVIPATTPRFGASKTTYQICPCFM